MSIKRMILYTKISLSLLALVSMFSVVFFISNASSKRIDSMVKSEHGHVINSINGYLTHFKEENLKFIDTFFTNENSLQLLKENKRQEFYTSILPTYNKFKSTDKSLWGMHFISKDGMSFIRVHSPELKDSYLHKNKQMLHLALSTQKVQYGFEAGKLGYFYRIIYPLFLDNDFLGVCEFSYQVSDIAKDFYKHYGHDIAFVFKETSNTKELIDYTHKSADGYIIQDVTNQKLYQYISNLNIDQKRFSTFETDEKTFSVYTYNLKDMQNKSKFVSMYDISYIIERRITLLQRLAIILMIVTIIAVIIINVILNFLMKNILQREKEVSLKNNELHHKSRHNDLTNLPNITVMHENVSSFQNYSVLMLNVDNTSILNTTYGSDIVNLILKESAKCLNSNLPKNAVLYHMSADEFTILLNKPIKNQELLLASQIKAYFEQTPIFVENIKVHINFSTGIAQHKEISVNKLNTFTQANIALLEAKHRGKSLILMYNESMSNFGSYTQLAKNIAILQRDLENESLTPFYQPIVDTYTKKVYKYEVLARIKDESGKIISPFHFMEAAEVSGLQTAITKQIIQKSFKYFESSSTQFSINITKHDFLENYLIEFLTIKIKKHNIDPKNVTLEILEDIAIENNEEIVTQINALGSLGYVIAIDDFGVESSNMSKLADLNADFIKIDGSFIKDMNDNETHLHIVEALVFIAKKLNMKIIAEFVHNEEIYELVKKLEIDYSQGYYFGEPKHTI